MFESIERFENLDAKLLEYEIETKLKLIKK